MYTGINSYAISEVTLLCPKEVLELVDRFNRNREAYLSAGYNEEQLRNEFINPFFITFGWDVYNEQGYAEAYKDVIHEEAIKIGGATKAPDYCFRIGGTRKFFLEAKRPSVKIKEDAGSAFQLRRYAWSANLPLSILTNFEEFAVYDCRIKPHKDDKASIGRILHINCEEFPARWDEIYSIFARDAVLKGSFDKYAESTRRKKGTAEVDDAFLKEIERWRENLARNIALRNTNLTQRELNFAVQMTIDRMIFLRICEDRGIEQYGRLMSLLNGEKVYQRLFELFRLADERYNSGLFHFRAEKERASEPDELTPALAIDDKALKEIIRDIYYPESPYEFSVLPADILGQVYEQFLGKVIRLTAGHHAVVEDKPEVKKAGGVYYTPTYIVDYIVKNTVGKLLEGKNPRQAEKIKILDPACGSGSFLLGAYQKLLDWHIDWYIKSRGIYAAGKRSKNPVIYQTQGGGWRLTTSERKRILLNSMYGVDIDPQAVEVTKLSLLLKVLEGENQQTIDRQFKLLHERALPDLSDNIKCGNSLIGPDFYEGKQINLFDEEERYRVNTFDWHAEFPEIFTRRNPGFDAVIGNPPYFSAVRLERPVQNYLKRKYIDLWASRNDISYYFLLSATRISKAYVSFIVPRYYLNSFYAKNFRGYMANSGFVEVVDTGNYQCFPGVNILTTIFTLKICDLHGVRYCFADNLANRINIKEILDVSGQEVISDNWNFSTNKKLLAKITLNKDLLGKYFKVAKGMSTGLNRAFEIDYTSVSRFSNRKFLRPLIKNGDIRRYVAHRKPRFVIFLEDITDLKELTAYKCHLTSFEKELKARKSASGLWFHYSTPRNRDFWDWKGTKIVVPFMATENRFALESRNVISTSGDVNALVPQFGSSGYKITYFLGLLNSKLMNFYHRMTTKLKRGGYMEYVSKQLHNLPVYPVDFSNPSDKSRHDEMVKLVELMLDLHKRISALKTEHEKTVLQRQIDATDKQIDNLVYELYNLTDDEIKIVEGTM